MKKLAKVILTVCFCLLIAAVPVRSVEAAGADAGVNVTYITQGSQGAGGSEGSTTIDAGKVTSPVKTGDASLPMTYLVMVIISAGLILLILLKNKKEEKEEESAF